MGPAAGRLGGGGGGRGAAGGGGGARAVPSTAVHMGQAQAVTTAGHILLAHLDAVAELEGALRKCHPRHEGLATELERDLLA